MTRELSPIARVVGGVVFGSKLVEILQAEARIGEIPHIKLSTKDK